jgi:hypothetical protein
MPVKKTALLSSSMYRSVHHAATRFTATTALEHCFEPQSPAQWHWATAWYPDWRRVCAETVKETTGAGLSQFAKDEFDDFLGCGILAHGFLRLRCGDRGASGTACTCAAPEVRRSSSK